MSTDKPDRLREAQNAFDSVAAGVVSADERVSFYPFVRMWARGVALLSVVILGVFEYTLRQSRVDRSVVEYMGVEGIVDLVAGVVLYLGVGMVLMYLIALGWDVLRDRYSDEV